MIVPRRDGQMLWICDRRRSSSVDDDNQSKIRGMRFLSICELLQAFKGTPRYRSKRALGVGGIMAHVTGANLAARCRMGGPAFPRAGRPIQPLSRQILQTWLQLAHGCAMLWCHGANTPKTPPDPSSAGATVDSLQTILTHTFKSLAILGSVGIPTSSSNRGLILFLTTPT